MERRTMKPQRCTTSFPGNDDVNTQFLGHLHRLRRLRTLLQPGQLEASRGRVAQHFGSALRLGVDHHAIHLALQSGQVRIAGIAIGFFQCGVHRKDLVAPRLEFFVHHITKFLPGCWKPPPPPDVWIG